MSSEAFRPDNLLLDPSAGGALWLRQGHVEVDAAAKERSISAEGFLKPI